MIGYGSTGFHDHGSRLSQKQRRAPGMIEAPYLNMAASCEFVIPVAIFPSI